MILLWGLELGDIMTNFKYKEYSVKIWADQNAEDPREWDNAGTMICFHSRYTLGDKNQEPIKDLQKFVKRREIISLPLYLYDHSVLSISTETFVGRAQHAEWDSGQVGYIFITRKDARREVCCGRLSDYYFDRVLKLLKSEVEVYDSYLSGNVYGFTITKPDGVELESYGGFYGYDHEKSGIVKEIKAIVDADIKLYR